MKALQIRNVPDEAHPRLRLELKARVAMEGKSLSELALAEFDEVPRPPHPSGAIKRVLGPRGRCGFSLVDRARRIGGRRVAPRLPFAREVTARIFPDDETLRAPHLLSVDVAQVGRRYVALGDLTAQRGAEADRPRRPGCRSLSA